MTLHPYPDREHQNADATARRRALAAVAALTDELNLMRAALERGPEYRVDTEMAQVISAKAQTLSGFLGELSALYDVREWHAADLAECGQAPRETSETDRAGERT
jgi:hypothetical protein